MSLYILSKSIQKHSFDKIHFYMKVFTLSALMFLVYGTIFGQKSIQGLILTEQSFAQYAFQENTRDAFVKYLDSNCVVFDNGKVVNGYQLWLSRQKNNAKLIWQPAFAAIASSHDYGVTTGPWEYKPTISDSATARGSFTSIWHYTSKGEWKNILDFGVNYNEKHEHVKPIVSYVSKENGEETEDILTKENLFIAHYCTYGSNVYKNEIATAYWFNTNGYLPLHGIQNLDKAAASIPGGIDFKVLAHGISQNNDFAYVYGTATLNNKTGNYLRVWINENKQWKLLVQTLELPE